MHVGYVLKKFPRASETFILNEILALQRRGVRVTVFSLHRPDDGVFHRALADLAGPVVYLPSRRSDAWIAHLRQHRDLLGDGTALLAQFSRLLTAARPDLWQLLGWQLDLALSCREHGVQHLHAHFATVAAHAAAGAAALAGVPFSVTCHAKDIYRDGVTAADFTALLQPAAFVVTVCDANRRWIHERLDGEGLPVRVLYNGVDTTTFHPRHREATGTPMLLAVGRLVEKKGFHVLLDALAALRDAGFAPRCTIVGDGEERERLLAQKRRLRLDAVEFVGMRTHDEVRRALHTATAMALPCIVGQDGNRDALPTVLLEALAAGVPVVSTAVGGVEEIVDGGRAGVLVPENDPAALAAALRAVLADEQTRARLAAAGRAHAERCFDLERIVATLAGWFAAAIAHDRAPLEVR
ncbi:MAG: glycosyltransferase family 4 protein [Planctomycetota bacterium]